MAIKPKFTYTYRVSFSPNFLEPFYWGVESFELACEYASVLADFDLGRIRIQDTSSAQQRMLAAYQAFRRSHGINHPELIETSTCTIDIFYKDNWWIISEDLMTQQYEPEEVEA